MMNYFLAFMTALIPVVVDSQITITYQVQENTMVRSISPYIYGSCNGGYPDATVVRIGGNRLTGYNWENNASHAGADYFYQNDAYLPWIMGIPAVSYDVPGIVMTEFHQNALNSGAMSLLTLPMAGYVSNDRNGTTVETWEAAPSARWAAVQNTKPTAFSLTPDVNDGTVYVDEFINFMQNQFGTASSATGVKGYILDNEPGLWTSTHGRLYTGAINCTDHLTKSLALARRVREMDAGAKIFGPEAYGYSEYLNFQGAGDWSTYSGTYSHYLALYLDSMRLASLSEGSRLLDVLSVHWYPDVYAGSVFSSDVSPNIARERMQLPRTLWDSSYIENGWIGEWFSQDLPILPKLNSLINTYYPGTDLAVTEYDYGADAHISGGIAQVEALGAFATTGTEYATKWGAFSDYTLSAVSLFNEGMNPFGDQLVASVSPDLTNSSIFGSVSTTDGNLHLIVTNKNADSVINANFQLADVSQYDSVKVSYFTQSSPTIVSQDLPNTVFTANGFSYQLQPLTAYHFVLKSGSVSSVNDLSETTEWNVFPNPANDGTLLKWVVPTKGALTVVNSLGKTVNQVVLSQETKEFYLDMRQLESGVYWLDFCSLKGEHIRKLVVKN
ncbi:MAG: hypothetical protein A3D31_06680 [Candidatus Fluviicola riflensis]|nr:MAG: hypothetical protein A3D31_06680 [Candidatus Fluviicola riflensis]OGS87074.1 MAG: hypothetical protein A2724_06140 [Fluviicola sp. RIFCSPHIGHO2_01_FULL_43_53]OGS89865.1 MAG: hypothetical protein A3E30_02890 [Fluviicola sp. RIFCSPHIGHO2_12_FULL_43_24]